MTETEKPATGLPIPHPSGLQLEYGVKLFLAGALAGVMSRTATAPADRLKMLMQVHEGKRPLSFREGLGQMLSEKSVRAWFRGNGANCIKVGPETALKLTLNEEIRTYLEALLAPRGAGDAVSDLSDTRGPGEPSSSGAGAGGGAPRPYSLSFLGRVGVGGVSGAVAQTVIYPLEVVKTRLAVAPPRTYTGIGHCFAITVEREGWRALYRGLTPSLVGILPYAGVDIAAFSVLKEWLIESYRESGAAPLSDAGVPILPGHAILGAGVASSIVAQVISYPLAVIRTRMQAQGVGVGGGGGGAGEERGSRTMSDLASRIYRRDGLRGFYRGIIPNVFKVAPAAGISWWTFERAKEFMGV